MLQITVPSKEFFDEKTQTFFTTKEYTLRLEHSLLSIDKWESKWHKAFISRDKNSKHSTEEMLDYIKCMTLNNVPDEAYLALTPKNIKDINEYINDPMTATTVREQYSNSMRGETITSTLIYYWMIAFGIPFECEKWHINKLIMLIKVTSAKSNPKKMGRKDILSQNHALNQARRRALGTRG